MLRPKGLVEMTKHGCDKPHERGLDVEGGAKMFRYKALKRSRAGELVITVAGSEGSARHLPAKWTLPIKGWRELNSQIKGLRVPPISPTGKIHLVSKENVKFQTSIPRIPAIGSRSNPGQEPAVTDGEVIWGKAAVGCAKIGKQSSRIAATVMFSPRKGRIKSQDAKVDAPDLRPHKPLKVIRRRGEQAPKIFETTAKQLPRAMLEGVGFDFEAEDSN